jgi:hypothetical protein
MGCQGRFSTDFGSLREVMCCRWFEISDGVYSSLGFHREPVGKSQRELNVSIVCSDTDDVAQVVMDAINSDLNHPLCRISKDKVKRLLNDRVVSAMTLGELAAMDSVDEIKGWMLEISKRF